jgi:hypothetical protein
MSASSQDHVATTVRAEACKISPGIYSTARQGSRRNVFRMQHKGERQIEFVPEEATWHVDLRTVTLKPEYE